MSGGLVCRCPERQKPITERAWEVTVYKGNYSAFNGYRFTFSEYSEVVCNICLRRWRTKARYVYDLSVRQQEESHARE